MRKHVQRILNHQHDILSPQAVDAVEKVLAEFRKTLLENPRQDALLKQMEELEKVANKWLKPYPNAAFRENVEVLLVALAVAMGVRTFFLQPFKIPTGSMQPTLFGVTSSQDQALKIPTGWERIKAWFSGTSYIHVVAEADGPWEGATEPTRFLIFNIKQTLIQGGRAYTIWFP